MARGKKANSSSDEQTRKMARYCERWRQLDRNGFCATGEFHPSLYFVHLVDNELFSRRRLIATMRFTVALGATNLLSEMGWVRGLALRLQDESQFYDLGMTSSPERSDAPFISHSATTYRSLYTFIFTGPGGTKTLARMQLVPEAGCGWLETQQQILIPKHALQRDMDERLLGGPVGFSLIVRLAKSQISLGRLSITALLDCDCVPYNFEPTKLPSGIELVSNTSLAWI